MEYIPIKTRIMQPPKDDLFLVLAESLPALRERDVLVLSSKVVAIHEGRCVPISAAKKSELVAQESELTITRDYWATPLTVRHHAFIGNAGVDESNADGHYVLLPEDPFASARTYWEHVRHEYGISDLGIVIVDSHSSPLRRGATGIAIGWWGFEPIVNHIGDEDLFGRTLRLEVTDLVDGIAAGANVVMGETNECQPLVIVRGTPNLTFTEAATKNKLMMPFAKDTFRVLYERFLREGS